MKNSIKSFVIIAAATVCMGAMPLAISYGPQIKAAAEARQQRAATQEVADINTAAGYRLKLQGCKKQANDSYLHFLERMSFISECMSNS
jgi:hypothetical protein